MKKLLAPFSHNWGLKLLALVLALVIFYSVRDSLQRRTGETSGGAPALSERTNPHVLP